MSEYIEVGQPLQFTDPNTPTRVGEIVESVSDIYNIPSPRLGMQVFVKREKKSFVITSLKSKVINGVDVPEAAVEAFEAVGAKSITWNNDTDPSNMNDFVVAGVYDIKGEHKREDDNLPVLNTGSGHSFNARLTVLDSSISGDGKNDDKCITQVLSFSNRLGQGEVYIRTGKGSSLDNLTWENWSTLQRNVTVVSVESLDNLIDNGIYSGVLNPTGETFVLVVINNYALASQYGTQKCISQFKYSVNYTGAVVLEKRVKIGNSNWGNWKQTNEEWLNARFIELEDRMFEYIDKEIRDIIEGTNPDTIDSIKDLVNWVEKHGADAAKIIEDINKNTEAIAGEKTRAEQAEQDIKDKAVEADSLNFQTRADVVALDYKTIEGVGDEITIPAATTTTAGVMSAKDKGKLDSIEIINDLTTGGADKALSAEMGKELASAALGTSIHNSDYSNIQWPWRPGSITIDGTFKTYTSRFDFMRTEYLPTKDIVSVIFLSYYVNPYISPIAFYDGKKVLISAPLNSSTETVVNGKTVVDVPEGAIYMAFTSRQSVMTKFSFNYSPYLATAIIRDEIETNKLGIETIYTSAEITLSTLPVLEVSPYYVNANGRLIDGGGDLGSYVYDISGLKGLFRIKSAISNNTYVRVCRIENSAGAVLEKYPVLLTTEGTMQFIHLQGDASKCYVSVPMKDGVPANDAEVVRVKNKGLEGLNVKVEECLNAAFLKEVIVSETKDKLTNAYGYDAGSTIISTQYTSAYAYYLYEFEPNSRAVINVRSTPEAQTCLVAEIPSIEEFKIGGSMTPLVTGHNVGEEIEILVEDSTKLLIVLGGSNGDYAKYVTMGEVKYVPVSEVLTETNVKLEELQSVVGVSNIGEIICPDILYAVVGHEFNLYYESIVKGMDCGLSTPMNLYVDIQCPSLQNASNRIGVRKERMWQISNLTNSYIGEHPIYISVYNSAGTLISSKSVILSVVEDTQPAESKNILCIGDSLTNNGPIVSTCAEHFSKIGGAQPVFIGQRTTSGYKHEGYPGYTFASFVNSGSANAYFIFDIPQETNVSVDDKYSTNSSTYTVVDIRTEGQDNLLRLRCTRSGSTTPSSTGTLTKVSGATASPSSIQYSAFEAETGNPFWDSASNTVNFTRYRERIGLASKFDVVVIMLGTNDCIGSIKSSMQSSVDNAKSLINAILSDAGNYSTKIILQITPPDANTISSWQVYSDQSYSRKIGYWTNLWNLRKLLYEEFTKDEWKAKVYLGQAALGLDRYYGFPYAEVSSSIRISTIKEVYHTNSVHPNEAGYKQLGDGYYLQIKSLL